MLTNAAEQQPCHAVKAALINRHAALHRVFPSCREAEKEASALLQEARTARGLIEEAASAAAAALQQIEALKQAEKEAAAEVNEARNLAKQLAARK